MLECQQALHRVISSFTKQKINNTNFNHKLGTT